MVFLELVRRGWLSFDGHGVVIWHRVWSEESETRIEGTSLEDLLTAAVSQEKEIRGALFPEPVTSFRHRADPETKNILPILQRPRDGVHCDPALHEGWRQVTSGGAWLTWQALYRLTRTKLLVEPPGLLVAPVVLIDST